MEQAIRFASTGGPEVMRLEPVTISAPGPGELRIKHTAIPVNYVDIQQRSGQYSVPLPSGLGVEAAGIVEAVGEGVSDFTPGMPVVYMGSSSGTYATSGLCAARQAVPVPAGINLENATAIFLRAVLAWNLTHQVYVVKPDEYVVVHAATGVTGSLIARFSRMAGCRVIGVAANPDKVHPAKLTDIEMTIFGDDQDLAGRVKSLTDGKGAHVVFDSVGADTFVRSLECLRPRGMMVAFGNASGVIPPFAPWRELGHRGSLKMAWPMLRDFMSPQDMEKAVPAVLAGLASGDLMVEIGQRFALADAAEAHRLIENRQALGASILLP